MTFDDGAPAASAAAGKVSRRRFDVPVEDKVAFLRLPGSYPEPTTRVDVVETHLSWVFLADRLAYKMKKPVRHEFLDFRTLDARHRNCEEELRLNRRMARDVYLRTEALAIAPDGSMRLGCPGRPIDWLVVMRRLPRARMLDRAIESGPIDRAAVVDAAAMLARAYVDAGPIEILPSEYRGRLEDEVRDNSVALRNPLFEMPAPLVGDTAARQVAFLRDQASLFDARVETGRIIEAHGDLRPEHISLGPPPVIIDCLEFSRDLRLLDPVDDLAFLAMECGRLGAAHVGRLFLDTYARLTRDRAPEAMISFYMSHRATVRAKIAAWHVRDARPEDRPGWIAAARGYVDIAARCIHDAAGQVSSSSTIDPPT